LVVGSFRLSQETTIPGKKLFSNVEYPEVTVNMVGRVSHQASPREATSC